MLTPLDDYLAHQIPDTFNHVGSSDLNFYERYYFNMHSSSDEVFLVFGLGQYPNLGVTDAFATVSYKDRQYVVRASRELGPNRLDTRVGPFRIEVLEGLRRLRAVLEPNEWGVEYDITWDGAIPAFLEPHFFTRSPNTGRVVQDYKRLSQLGCWSGYLKVAGQTFQVTPDRFWGSRDHAWGIRPIGSTETPAIDAKSPPKGSFWNYSPMQFKDFSLMFISAENHEGCQTQTEALRIHSFESGGEVEHLSNPRHKIEFIPGTRRPKRATLYMTEPSGRDLEIKVTPLRTVFVGAGTGYTNIDPNWKHGMYQGPLKVEGLEWDLSDPDIVKRISILQDVASRFEVDGHVGYGLFEIAVNGVYLPYGFKSPADVAP